MRSVVSKKRVDFFYRTADGGQPRLVGSDHFGPEDILDASIGFACPFCGETALVDFHRPEGDWPDAVTLVCDAGRDHQLDETQPRREVNEYPLTLGWERCPRCDAVARREVASADATHADVLCTADETHNYRDEL
jgi:hypothetical protein